MAQITINEISSNYGYNVADTSYASVALPITASWGPAFEDPAALGVSLDVAIEKAGFTHFPATQRGLEAFVATYRGPAANYRSANDYSYQLAITLLSAGYDLDVCRLCPGTHAQGKFQVAESETAQVAIKAKYPGTFGNALYVTLKKVPNKNYWNLITYVVDASGSRIAVENLLFVFNIEDSTDTILHVSELTSAFVDIIVTGITTETVEFDTDAITLVGGSDRAADGTVQAMTTDAIGLATARFNLIPASDKTDYIAALTAATTGADIGTVSTIRYKEWLYRFTMEVLDILSDKLAYSPSRIILPGWDDQDIAGLTGADTATISAISPLHARLLEIGFKARRATALIDIPKSLARADVWNTTDNAATEGYAQKLSAYRPAGDIVTDDMFPTHAALFAPWGQYTYAGTGKQAIASPSFLALMIYRATILNQPLQYEWAVATNKNHTLNIGKLAYDVPAKMLDQWQGNDGVGVNVITNIPGLGLNIWGDSTLYNKPPATWNALQNLSTRFLMNAVKDQAYKVGLGITFQYNNNEAYSKFYAGVSPLLDTMKNVGAITNYEISMAADIDGLESVNANSVVGQIQIFVKGIINDITIDLIALPAID